MKRHGSVSISRADETSVPRVASNAAPAGPRGWKLWSSTPNEKTLGTPRGPRTPLRSNLSHMDPRIAGHRAGRDGGGGAGSKTAFGGDGANISSERFSGAAIKAGSFSKHTVHKRDELIPPHAAPYAGLVSIAPLNAPARRDAREEAEEDEEMKKTEEEEEEEEEENPPLPWGLPPPPRSPPPCSPVGSSAAWAAPLPLPRPASQPRRPRAAVPLDTIASELRRVVFETTVELEAEMARRAEATGETQHLRSVNAELEAVLSQRTREMIDAELEEQRQRLVQEGEAAVAMREAELQRAFAEKLELLVAQSEAWQHAHTRALRSTQRDHARAEVEHKRVEAEHQRAETELLRVQMRLEEEHAAFQAKHHAMRSAMADAVHTRSMQVVRQAVARMTMVTQAHMYAAWVSYTQKAKRARTAAVRVISRFYNVQLARGFTKWVIENVHMAEKQTMRQALKKKAQEARAQRKRELMLRVVAHGKKKALSAGFRTWHERTVLLRRLVIFAARWKHHEEWSIFAKWRSNAKHAAHMKVVLRHAGAKLMHRTLTMGLDGWKRYMVRKTQRAHNLGVAQHAMARITKGLLSRSFASWLARTNSRHSAKEVVKRVTARIKNRDISRAFHTWLDFLAEWHEDWRRTKTVLSHATTRLANQETMRAFAKWKETVRHDQLVEAALQNTKALARLMRRLLRTRGVNRMHTALSLWRSFTSEASLDVANKRAEASLDVANKRAFAWWQQYQQVLHEGKATAAIAAAAGPAVPKRKPPPPPKRKPPPLHGKPWSHTGFKGRAHVGVTASSPAVHVSRHGSVSISRGGGGGGSHKDP